MMMSGVCSCFVDAIKQIVYRNYVVDTTKQVVYRSFIVDTTKPITHVQELSLIYCIKRVSILADFSQTFYFRTPFFLLRKKCHSTSLFDSFPAASWRRGGSFYFWKESSHSVSPFSFLLSPFSSLLPLLSSLLSPISHLLFSFSFCFSSLASVDAKSSSRQRDLGLRRAQSQIHL